VRGASAHAPAADGDGSAWRRPAHAHRRLHGGPRDRAARARHRSADARGIQPLPALRHAQGRPERRRGTMIHLTRALVRRWLDALLHIADTPERTAAAFALGVFFGFSPLIGFHTLLALVAAFFLDYNRVAVLIGVYSNLPWFLAPYYAIATMVGAELTGKHPPPEFRSQLGRLFELSLLHEPFWRRLAVV